MQGLAESCQEFGFYAQWHRERRIVLSRGEIWCDFCFYRLTFAAVLRIDQRVIRMETKRPVKRLVSDSGQKWGCSDQSSSSNRQWEMCPGPPLSLFLIPIAASGDLPESLRLPGAQFANPWVWGPASLPSGSGLQLQGSQSTSVQGAIRGMAWSAGPNFFFQPKHLHFE